MTNSCATTDGLHLLLEARSRIAALRVGDAIEVCRPLPVEPMAGAPSCVLGLSVIRATPTPVVDLGALLGDDRPRETRRFVTVRAGSRVVALAVEGVLGVRSIRGEDLGPVPSLLASADPGVVARVGVRDRSLLVLLEAMHLLPVPT